MVTFGRQVHSKGILGGTEEAGRHIGYLTKYLTKSTGEVVEADTARLRDHHDRLHAELSVTPCSPRCAVWLLYGIQPQGREQQDHCRGTARGGRIGGPRSACRGGGCWCRGSGREDARRPQGRPEGLRRGRRWRRSGSRSRNRTRARLVWRKVEPGDPQVPPRPHLVMHAIAERITWKAEYDRALLAAAGPPGERSRNFGNSARSLDRGRIDMKTKYLTVEEAAVYLNTAVRFVRRLIAERRIAFHKLGAHVRLALGDLDAFVQAGRVEPSRSTGRPAGRWPDGEEARSSPVRLGAQAAVRAVPGVVHRAERSAAVRAEHLPDEDGRGPLARRG